MLVDCAVGGRAFGHPQLADQPSLYLPPLLPWGCVVPPITRCLQGYILGQYGLLYALENEQSVAGLVVLNTPLGLKTPLRPELAAYKSPLPFLRPKAGATFPADTFNAAGGPYALAYKDAQAYLGAPGGSALLSAAQYSAAQHRPHLALACEHERAPAACQPSALLLPTSSTGRPACLPLPAEPYQADPAASAAVAATMQQVDFPALLKRVDQGYESWRRPSLLLFGTSGGWMRRRPVPRAPRLRPAWADDWRLPSAEHTQRELHAAAPGRPQAAASQPHLPAAPSSHLSWLPSPPCPALPCPALSCRPVHRLWICV